MSGSNEFYTLLTNLGINEIVKARAEGTELRLSKMAVGSSKELISQELVSLRDEKYRFNINSITQDADNANYLVVEGVIPSSVGGFEISEVGIFTDTDKLFAIAKVPTSYKPLLSEGSAKDFTIRLIIEMSNSDNVTLKVDESVVLATRNFVKGELKKYALVNGDETKVFKVANAVENNEAMNKAQINSLLEVLKNSLNSQISNIQGLPVGSLISGWAVPSNCIVAFGGTFKRSDYPKLWAYINSNPSIMLSDSSWQSQKSSYGMCGYFSSGDGSTTFRVPDLRQAFIRYSERTTGSYEGDSIRNITGYISVKNYMHDSYGHGGALEYGGEDNGANSQGTSGRGRYIRFDASRVVPTSSENRPKNIALKPLIVAK